MEEPCAKISITEQDFKRLIHSLRSSLARQLKRATEKDDYESSWISFKRMAFKKDDIMESLQQESSK